MPREPDLKEVGARFEIDGTWLRAARHGSGHIHTTYVSEFDQRGRVRRYLHQAINEEIFRDVPGLMQNLQRVGDHLGAKAAEGPGGSRWEVPRLVPARDGASWVRDAEGSAWRTFTYVEGARTFDAVPSPEIAREAASAFGRFSHDLADFDPSILVESIPRFHDLDGRLARLRGVVRSDPRGRVSELHDELLVVDAHAGVAAELRGLRDTGHLPIRVAHNDTKINNALIDEKTGRGVAVIDLDTVMPGTLLFDYGDLVRTATCRADEDEVDLSRVAVDLTLFEAVTEGYLSRAASIATSTELDHLLLGGRFMTLIIGVRFLTDYLEGDPYFRTTRPRQNLDRARAQLRLLQSIDANEERLNDLIRAALG